MSQDKDEAAISASHFREVLGQYPTGVAVVTACGEDGDPVGMVVGSFGSVSLDPPLVSFMPDKRSSSWARLSLHESFCVNILGAHQEAVCRNLASKRPDKFSAIDWAASGRGHPLIAGSIARIECRKEVVHEAGDHLIVIGRVTDLSVGAPGTPLLFYRGGYGTFTAQSMITGESEILDKIRLLDRVRSSLEALAAEHDTEVSAVAQVKDELVLIGSFGRSRAVDFPTRVGQRLPFMPPIGGVFAAWGGEAMQQGWLKRAGEPDSEDYRLSLRMIEGIRRRGYAIGFGHAASLNWERMAYLASIGDPETDVGQVRQAVAAVLRAYNPPEFVDGPQEFHFAQGPVFDGQGNVTLGVTIWGPDGVTSKPRIDAIVAALGQATADATRRIGGVEPASA